MTNKPLLEHLCRVCPRTFHVLSSCYFTVKMQFIPYYPLYQEPLIWSKLMKKSLLWPRRFLFLVQNGLSVKRCFPFPICFSPPPPLTNHSAPLSSTPRPPHPFPSVTSHDALTQLSHFNLCWLVAFLGSVCIYFIDWWKRDSVLPPILMLYLMFLQCGCVIAAVFSLNGASRGPQGGEQPPKSYQDVVHWLALNWRTILLEIT